MSFSSYTGGISIYVLALSSVACSSAHAPSEGPVGRSERVAESTAGGCAATIGPARVSRGEESASPYKLKVGRFNVGSDCYLIAVEPMFPDPADLAEQGEISFQAGELTFGHVSKWIDGVLVEGISGKNGAFVLENSDYKSFYFSKLDEFMYGDCRIKGPYFALEYSDGADIYFFENGRWFKTRCGD